MNLPMQTEQQRIGIYGGTFNPIHHGHLVAAQSAAEALALSSVVFVPSGTPPLKPCTELASAQHRLAMVQLAIAGNPLFSSDDHEVRGTGKSYTVDTMRHLAARYPAGTALFFIVGQDCAAKLHHWKGIAELQRLASFVRLNRAASANPADLAPDTPPLLDVSMPALELSSTLLRARLARGRPVSYLTPPAVADYIARHGLYRAASDTNTNTNTNTNTDIKEAAA